MAGDIGELAQTAGVAGAGGLTIIGVVTWFLKTLREQRAANRDERGAETIEAGTTAVVSHLTSEVNRLTSEVEKLVGKNETLASTERTTAIENAQLNAKVGGLLTEIRDLRADLTAEKERSAKLETRLAEIEQKLSKRASDRPEMHVPLRRAEDKE